MINEQSEIIIRISQLSEGIHEYGFISQPSQIGLSDNFRENIEIHVILEKTQRQMHLKTQISTKAEFQCDRCANEFDRDINSEFSVYYTFDENSSTANTDDELRIIHPGTPFLNLTEDIRQFLMLSVPMKLICREDCKGLCPQCGTNLNTVECDCTTQNTDSRWDELRKLITVTNN